MTALPDPSEFVPHAQFARQSPVLARPAVSEHYWGYEISKRIQVIDLAVLTRAVAGFLTIACFVPAIMVWLVPAMAFTGDVMMGKALASVGMACLGALMFRFARARDAGAGPGRHICWRNQRGRQWNVRVYYRFVQLRVGRD